MIDHRPTCTSIKDQNSCGSCTAFATLGIMEQLLKLKEDVFYDLSEQDLFMCSNGGCDRGNTMSATFNRAKRGVPTEVCCPYLAKDTKCGEERCEEWWTDAKKIKSWRKLNSRKEVDEALARGSVVGTMAVHQSFLHYTGGVYHSLGIGDPIVGYHAIGIVGYDEGKNADLLRNSWGTDWGMGGYCWILQGDSELEYYELVIDGEVAPDDEEQECPVANWFWHRGKWGKRIVRLWRKLKD